MGEDLREGTALSEQNSVIIIKTEYDSEPEAEDTENPPDQINPPDQVPSDFNAEGPSVEFNHLKKDPDEVSVDVIINVADDDGTSDILVQKPEMVILPDYSHDHHKAANEKERWSEEERFKEVPSKNDRLNAAYSVLYSINTEHLCPLCGDLIKTDQMLDHALVHCDEGEGNRPMCFLCLRDFTCHSQLKWHIKVRHMGTKDYECEVCKKKFPRQGNLSEHMKSHLGDRKHKCTVCPKSFSTNSMLLRHLKTHTDERDHICPVCGKGFAQKGNLMKHKCFRDESRIYTCEICNKEFKAQYNLSIHLKIHGERITFDCQYCTRQFLTRHRLKDHIQIKHIDEVTDGSIKPRKPPERKYKCQVCGEKAYTSKGALDYHMLGAHPDLLVGKDNVQHFFKCEVCNKTVIGKHSYVRHVKIHSMSGNKFKCQYCEKLFATKIYRRNHEKLHGDERSHVCLVCNKGFPLKQYLRRHEKTHSNEKKFQCSTCGEMFASHEQLQIHGEKHGGIKNFECTVCFKKFSEKSLVTRHMKTHRQMEKYHAMKRGPRKRGVSKKSIITNSPSKETVDEDYFLCNKDIILNDESTPTKYDCAICNQSFSRKSVLTRHVKNHCEEIESFESNALFMSNQLRDCYVPLKKNIVVDYHVFS